MPTDDRQFSEELERDHIASSAREPDVSNERGAYEVRTYRAGVGFVWEWTTPKREEAKERESMEADYRWWRNS